MNRHARPLTALVAVLVFASVQWTSAQTSGEKERFTATAIANNNLGSGTGTVLIDIDRWSTEAERTLLVKTLLAKGPRQLLDALMDQRSVGNIRTPDSIGYDLRYAHQAPLPEGGRRIVIATDRPIGFWEQVNNTRTLDYPFTVIQMQIDRHGTGTGTLSYATKIRAHDNIIELEHFATSPVMLTKIESRKR